MQQAFLWAGALSLAGLVAGCTTRAKAQRDAEFAFLAGRGQALARQQSQFQNEQPRVLFRGAFRNRTVSWTEGLTLAEALVEAEFTGTWKPFEVILVRGGSVTRIRTRRLLNRQDNPVLRPGDQIEIIR